MRSARHSAATHAFSAFFRALAACCCAVALAAPLTSCAKPPPPKPTATRVVYTVKGRIVQLPEPGNPASEFRVHHEAIPDFRASLPNGALGMREMTMPFSLAPGVSLAGLGVGDPVLIKFEVQYALDGGQITDSHATAVTALPPETPLNLLADPARPATPAG